MKNLVIALSLLTIGLTVLSSCRDTNDDSCIEQVNLEQIFTAKANCSYIFENDTNTYCINISDINDLRDYGSGCESSWGGNAEIFFNINGNDEFMFNWPGCNSDIEHKLDNRNLPFYQFDSFQIKMVKMLPLTRDLDMESLPESIEEYEIRLGIIKN